MDISPVTQADLSSCTALLETWFSLGFEVILSRFTNNNDVKWCSSSRVLEQIVRGDCERSIDGDIQVVTGCTMAALLPRSPSLTRHPIFPPKLVPPFLVPPLYNFCN